MTTSPVTNHLATPFALPNGQTVKNRILKSALSEALGTIDNRVTDLLPTLYGRWARGGVGLCVTGNVMVDRRAIGEPHNVCLEDDRDMDMLRRWATEGKANGTLLYMQLNHPGRQFPRGLNRESVAPSVVPFSKKLGPLLGTPRALTDAEIRDLIVRFGTSAALAEQAGFDGVQIHGAHGYLVSQFLSPLSNLRDDDWGGDPERRRAFLLAVYRQIRQSTSPGFGVGLKINSADFQRGGFTEEESMAAILSVAAEGLDFVEVSGGTYEVPAMVFGDQRESTRQREAYFLEFARALRDQLSIPLVVTGGFRTGAAMNSAIAEGAVDLVGMGRPLALYPDFPGQVVEDPGASAHLEPRTTGIDFVDSSGAIELAWYERQLRRMGKGLEPRADESIVTTVGSALWATGWRSFQSRRAR